MTVTGALPDPTSLPARPELDPNTRIMHVLTESTGPIADVAKVAVAGHVEAGHEVAVAARPEVFAALDMPESALLRHIPVAIAAGPRPGDPDAALTLHKYYRHVDLVHAHGLHAAAVAGLGFTGLPAGRRPVLVATVGRFGSRNVFAKTDAALVARTASAVLGTTEPVVEHFADSVATVERARLMRADLDRNVRPTRSKAAVRKALGIQAGTWLVASPVELVDHTALTTIVDAATQLSAHRADRRWTVALSGTGGLRGLIGKEFARPGRGLVLADHDDTIDLLAAADVVLASDRMGDIDPEDLMQLAKPVVFVGTERGARMWGDAAFATPADSTEELLDAVFTYIDSPAARGAAGIAARRRVDDADSGAFLAEDLRALYAGLLSGATWV
ncbi:group 1 glycosyl transferase [Brevibacterium samyangense]|uniref:Uncharacterized protein n=1 Tax=Brevibacterium samyangense TaxID=366888 RepID=A0ABP5ERE1_9MICO